jgi:hypothetical protein
LKSELPEVVEKKIHMNKKTNKNTILAWATFIMVIMGFLLVALGAFRYDDVAGWGFAAVGLGFFAIAWVFNELKGRV